MRLSGARFRRAPSPEVVDAVVGVLATPGPHQARRCIPVGAVERAAGPHWASSPPLSTPARSAAGTGHRRRSSDSHWSALLETLPTPDRASLLDFGCGAASTQARAAALGYAWRGLDIPGSQEALGRSDRTGVTYYDGGRIPFPDNSFDVVLSVQVFEHVVDPHQTIAEIARIVKPGGHLLGSTSHIEPFHSASTFTYTPAVFARLLEQNRLRAQLISPGIDGLTIVARRLLRQFGAVEESKLLNQFFAGHSPLHELIDACGEAQGVDQRQINALKLELTGQFHFLAGKV